MTSSPKGYFIPRPKAGHQSVVVRDGQNKTEQLMLLQAVTAGSSFFLRMLTHFIERVANIVRIFMTLILIVSDLEDFRVKCQGADLAREAGPVLDL